MVSPLQYLKVQFKAYQQTKGGRSGTILKSIVSLFVTKGGNILIGLLMVPMVINYVSPLQYGIWLTVSSIAAWMSFFDIGLGNGLRNRLSHAQALNQYGDAKKYVSTTYAALSIVALGLLVGILVANPFIHWRAFLNVPATVTENIQLVVLVVLCSFCVQFVLQLINTVLTASHEPGRAAMITLWGQLAAFITIYILTKTVKGDLLVLVCVLTGLPILFNLIASIWLYKGKYKPVAPSPKSVDFTYARSILNIGGAFFFIQIGALILFQTDNIIITKVIGPTSVTEFNVTYKMYNTVTMMFAIVMVPYWSAFTDAYAKEDYDWMKKTLSRVRKLWMLLTFVVYPVLCLLSKPLFHLWVGKSVEIPSGLSVAMMLYCIGFTCLMVNCYFLNGIGKLRLQLYLYAVTTLINVPLGVYWAKKFGVAGVTYSNVVIFVVMGILLWIQSTKVVNRRASGLWSK
jgi:O-antigen/teichoic acid export membrane protein